MHICPICNTKNYRFPCCNCGFDESQNYEHYPTLVSIPKPSHSMAHHTSVHAAYFRCPTCNGTHFLINTMTNHFECAVCKQSVVGTFFPVKAGITTTEPSPKIPYTIKENTSQEDPTFLGCNELINIDISDSWQHTQPPVQNTDTSTPASSEEQYQKGESYYQEQKYQEALSWYQKAAQQNHALAQCRLGLMYRDGEGVTPNEKEAFYWFQKAANNGLASAMNMLAECYATGSGVLENSFMAAHWYEQAASLGNSHAMYALATCYAQGKGVHLNSEKAITLYEDAYQNGNLQGLEGLFQEYGSMSQLSETVCKKLPLLSKIQPSSLNTSKEFAFHYVFKKQPDSCMNIALNMLRYPSIKAIGIEWIEKCADSGLIRAQMWLGDSYRTGENVSKNKAKAIHYYEKAAAKGDLTAINRLKSLKKNGLSDLFS